MSRLVVDAHGHIFPFLGGPGGWESASAHVAAIQRLFGVARSATSGAADLDFSAPLPDINFKIGKFGRFEWTEDGIDYYRQVMPPSLQDQTASPEFMLAQMEHADVDVAVLQNAKVYGKLNEYFAEVSSKYPTRYVGLAEVDELNADTPDEIARLKYAIKDLGLRGIYYEATRFIEVGRMGAFRDPQYEEFWKEVGRLGIVVEWYLSAGSMSTDQYTEHLRMFADWAERHEEIPSIIVMGLYPLLFYRDGVVDYPDDVLRIVDKPNVYVEILYPIVAGRLSWDYPYEPANILIKKQYERLGPEKLIWGSDMPNVERNCTYRQSLTHLTEYCDFIEPQHMDLIVGGNAARLFKIETDVPRVLLGSKRGAMM